MHEHPSHGKFRGGVQFQLKPQDVVVCEEVATTSGMDFNTVITQLSSVNHQFSTGPTGLLGGIEQAGWSGK
jgi:hypothetical protein